MVVVVDGALLLPLFNFHVNSTKPSQWSVVVWWTAVLYLTGLDRTRLDSNVCLNPGRRSI